MEYDPASPTDEPEDPLPDVDLSSIPLPDIGILPSVQCGDAPMITTCITDIPLPPTDLKASEIPLPPAPSVVHYAPLSFEQPIPAAPPPPPPPPPVTADHSEPDSTSVPLKFSLRSSAKGLGQDVSSEPSGVFESSKDLKTSEPRAMPKLQALMKRSKPSKLTVGVLPSKTKLPATETKTELFLPTKESDESNGVTAALEVAASLASTINSSGIQSAASNQTSDPNELLTNAMKEVSALNSLAHMASTGNVAQITVEGSRAELSAHLPATLPSANNSATHIPNLMSLTVQPVQPTPQPTALSADPTSVLRQPKMNLANMQFVNPQKLRSAQMIATPLIANPAIAAQPHHSDEQSKSRDSRRRSRSRSRRRSHSGRRSSPNRRSRRHHSSSSGGSTPRHSSRGYQRRSRSRHSSEERYPRPRRQSRGRDWDRRERDRWREDSFESDRRRRSDTQDPEDSQEVEIGTDANATAGGKIRSSRIAGGGATDRLVNGVRLREFHLYRDTVSDPVAVLTLMIVHGGIGCPDGHQTVTNELIPETEIGFRGMKLTGAGLSPLKENDPLHLRNERTSNGNAESQVPNNAQLIDLDKNQRMLKTIEPEWIITSRRWRRRTVRRNLAILLRVPVIHTEVKVQEHQWQRSHHLRSQCGLVQSVLLKKARIPPQCMML